MALTDQRYTVRLPLPDLIVRGRSHVLQAPVYLSGSLVTPDSATVSVYDATNAAVVDAAAATITGGVATYTIASGDLTSYSLGDGWRVEWVITLDSGEILTPRNDASLVRSGLWPVISDVDLARRVPGLSPSAAVQLTRATTYQDAIDEAWVEIQLRLIAKGNRPNLVMEPSALRSVHLYLALALVMEDQELRSAPVYEQRAQAYRDAYERAWAELSPRYDSDDDGVADTRRRASAATIWLCGGDR